MSDRRERERRRRDQRQRDQGESADRRHLGDRREQERRASYRVDLELWFEEVAEGAAYLRCAANVGEGGVYFDHAVPHPVGTTLRLSFSLPDDPRPIAARGEVVSNAPATGGEGIKFITFEDDGEQRLTRFIEAAAARGG